VLHSLLDNTVYNDFIINISCNSRRQFRYLLNTVYYVRAFVRYRRNSVIQTHWTYGVFR